jgi:hypothetical protein
MGSERVKEWKSEKVKAWKSLASREMVPQGLKPLVVRDGDGTTEVVP